MIPLDPHEAELPEQVAAMERDFGCTIQLMHPRDRKVTTTITLPLPSGTKVQSYLLIGTLALSGNEGFFLAIGSEDWFMYPLPAPIALTNLAI